MDDNDKILIYTDRLHKRLHKRVHKRVHKKVHKSTETHIQADFYESESEH